MSKTNNTGEVFSLSEFSTPDVAFSLKATIAPDSSVVLYKYERNGSNHDSKFIVIKEDEFDMLANLMGYYKDFNEGGE